MSLTRLPSGEYLNHGRTLPGVTRVLALLRPYAGIPQETLALAQRRGQAAHYAIHLLEGGGDGSGLDMASVHPLVLPHVQAWEKFKAETKWVTLATEEPVVSTVYGYAGTPDLFGTLRGIPSVIDCKCGMALTVPLQTAAQAQSIKESRRLKQKPRRYSLFLRSTGKYNLIEHADASDWATFLALLQVYQWQRKFTPSLLGDECQPDFSNYEDDLATVLGGANGQKVASPS